MHALRLCALCAGLAAVLGVSPLQPTFNGFQLQPSPLPDISTPFSPPRVAWIILVAKPPTKLYVSLLQRYKAALAPFKTVDLLVCLSASNHSYTEDEAQTLHAKWLKQAPGINIQLVTSKDIVTNFPALAPLPRVEASALGTAPASTHRSFEWAHHEPSLMSLKDVQRYAYIWYSEMDVTYKGNMTKWFEDVHAIDPQVANQMPHVRRRRRACLPS